MKTMKYSKNVMATRYLGADYKTNSINKLKRPTQELPEGFVWYWFDQHDMVCWAPMFNYGQVVRMGEWMIQDKVSGVYVETNENFMEHYTLCQ